MNILSRFNCKVTCLAMAIVALMFSDATGQINIEDEASAQTPFKLLWGFDTGG